MAARGKGQKRKTGIEEGGKKKKGFSFNSKGKLSVVIRYKVTF